MYKFTLLLPNSTIIITIASCLFLSKLVLSKLRKSELSCPGSIWKYLMHLKIRAYALHIIHMHMHVCTCMCTRPYSRAHSCICTCPFENKICSWSFSNCKFFTFVFLWAIADFLWKKNLHLLTKIPKFFFIYTHKV